MGSLDVLTLADTDPTDGQALVYDDANSNWKPGTVATSVDSDSITDATTVGKSVLTATDKAAARTAIGAGTSDLELGTTSTTALAGDTGPSDIGAATSAQGALADSATQPGDLATVATSGKASDLTDKLNVAQSAAGAVLAVHYDTSTSSWPSRPTSRTDVTVNYYAATSSDPAPGDYIAGVDYLYQPNS